MCWKLVCILISWETGKTDQEKFILLHDSCRVLNLNCIHIIKHVFILDFIFTDNIVQYNEH